MENTYYYFAYGSNLSWKQMEIRCKGCRPIQKALLRGYRLEFQNYSQRWGGGGATIVQQNKCFVEGGIYLLSEAHKKHLDKYEKNYERISVTVETVDGKKNDCFTYIAQEGFIMPPSISYLSTIMEGYRNFGWEFSTLTAVLLEINYIGKALFFYGTFKTGQSRHYLLKKYMTNFSSFLENKQLFLIQNTFPCIIKGKRKVQGEIFLYGDALCQELPMVDKIENFDSKFQKGIFLRKIELFTLNYSSLEQVIPAWYYEASPQLEHTALQEGIPLDIF